MHDAELRQCFARMRQGEREAFTEVYRDLSRPVYTVILRIVGRCEQAEDIAQELFVKLFQSPLEDTVKSPRAWIFRMAHNMAIDAMRTQHTVQSVEGDECVPAENEIAQANVRLDVARAMSHLSQAEREVVSLHIYGELGFAEIARTMGMSLSAVWRIWRRALNRMREELGGHI